MSGLTKAAKMFKKLGFQTGFTNYGDLVVSKHGNEYWIDISTDVGDICDILMIEGIIEPDPE